MKGQQELFKHLKKGRTHRNQESGMTLIEVLIALAILGITAVAFLSAAATATKSVILAQERVAAESLAKSQLEYMKSQTYDITNNPPVYLEITPPAGYTINSAAERLDPLGDGTGNDDSLQKITVTVLKDGDELLDAEDYKVNR